VDLIRARVERRPRRADSSPMPGTLALDLPDCRPLLADPDDLAVVLQPVVDLATAQVAGWEALARFPGTATPEVWAAAAAEAGVAAELEALAVAKALDGRPGLPEGTSLTVDVSAHLLGSAPVQRALRRRPDLSRVVVRLTERTPVEDLAGLVERAARLRERGAVLAFDDTANGYAGLRTLAALRPQLVVVDRALLADGGADPVRADPVRADPVRADPVRAELAGLTAELAGRTGARLLVRDLETPAELAAAVRRGVPLGRGWLLGRPAPVPAPLDPRTADLVRGHAARARHAATLGTTVASLLRPVRLCEEAGAVAVPPAVLVGTDEDPRGLLLTDPRTRETYRAPVSLRVGPAEPIGATLRRALARPPAQRFDPVLCADPAGRVLGLVRVDDLASAAHSA
jgi:EAL domain-containing protein (putative c-di-GMP-specific phosphodiesterase class I)